MSDRRGHRIHHELHEIERHQRERRLNDEQRDARQRPALSALPDQTEGAMEMGDQGPAPEQQRELHGSGALSRMGVVATPSVRGAGALPATPFAPWARSSSTSLAKSWIAWSRRGLIKRRTAMVSARVAHLRKCAAAVPAARSRRSPNRNPYQ